MRVVAYTLDPSLGVALSTMDDWEVVSAGSVEEAVSLAPHASVVVVGMGTTGEGLTAAEEIYTLGVTIPSVVVGDVPAPDDAQSPVVCRPFSLDDLRTAVDVAIAGALAPNGVHADFGQAADPYEVEDDQAAMPVNIIDLQQERMIRIEADGVAEIEADEPDEGAPPEPSTTHDAPPAAAASGSAAPARQQPSPAQPAPAPPASPQPQQQQQPARPPAPVAQPAPPREEPKPQRSAEPKRRRMGRKSKQAATKQDDSPLVRKMRRVAAAGKDLDELIAELPMLADLSSMSGALLGEVVDRFAPEIASVYVRAEKGFRVVASHGLSKVERGLVVSLDHPLFGEMLRTPEAVLISPVDLAQGLVAGIGGARTESMIIAPVQVDGRCVAVLVVGRHDFSESDLDSLDDLATEAAPGLAVAQLLDRLRGD